MRASGAFCRRRRPAGQLAPALSCRSISSTISAGQFRLKHWPLLAQAGRPARWARFNQGAAPGRPPASRRRALASGPVGQSTSLPAGRTTCGRPMSLSGRLASLAGASNGDKWRPGGGGGVVFASCRPVPLWPTSAERGWRARARAHATRPETGAQSDLAAALPIDTGESCQSEPRAKRRLSLACLLAFPAARLLACPPVSPLAEI